MQSFHPPKIHLFGPGPSPVHSRVLNAMSRPTLGHLDPDFIRMMDEIKDGLRDLFQTKNAYTMPISGPGTAGQEALIVNILEPGDTFVVCINGVFGGRMAQMAERVGAKVVKVETPWGRAIDPEALRATLKQHPDVKLVGFVHAETSTGVLSDAKTLTQIAKDAGALVLMDCVTSLGGVPVELDAWGVDAAYSGTQKCLAVPPGLAPVSFNDKVFTAVKARKTPVTSWFMDVNLLTGYWQDGGKGGRSYHHTAPVNALYGLHEGLVMLNEEGYTNVWARHAKVHAAFVAGVKALGLNMSVPEAEQAPSINAVSVPDGVDEAEVRKQLLTKHHIEIGAGLGPMAGKIWRIGTMGQGASMDNIRLSLNALEDVLAEQGFKVAKGAAEKAINTAS